MISKNARFHGPRAVPTVLKKGKTSRAAQLSVKSMPAKLATGRLAVVVSKKIDKRAAVRNRIRRVIFEIIRKNNLLPAKTDVVVMVYNRDIATQPVTKTLEQLESAFRSV